MKRTLSIVISFILILQFLTDVAAQPTLSGKTASSMPTYIGELTTNVGTGYGEYRTVGTDALEVEKPTIIGTTYLTDDWSKGELFITLNRLLQTKEFKYDLENNQFLIKTENVANPTPDQLKVIYSNTVDAFKLTDPVLGERFFLNATNAGLTTEGKPTIGFLEVLINNKEMSLYRKIDTELLRANYNAALHAGEKSDRIIKKETYYMKDGDQKELLEVSKRKKQNLSYFGKQTAAMEEFLKANKTNFSSATDLVQLISYYNTLPK